MEIKRAQFIKSSSQLEELPEPVLPEYAFVGRSNVGKSSLINCLVERNNLAKTSSTPGKTQLINHFLINESWYLVDLPGYGYAKVSKKQRAGFQQLMVDYLTQRENLMNVFVLVDSRLSPQQIDLEFIEFLGLEGIPFVIVFTKTDKPSQKELGQNLRRFRKTMEAQWEQLPAMMQSSSVKGRGRDEILNFIEATNPLFEKG